MTSPARLPLTGLPVAGTGRRSAALAAWTTAHLGGRTRLADAVAAAQGRDEPHLIDAVGGPGDLDGMGDGVGDLSGLLADLRTRGALGLRLVLPVPGDPRGLPGPGALTDAALAAGEAVLVQLPTADAPAYGLVPAATEHGSDRDGFTTVVRWRLIPAPSATPEPAGTARQVEHDLADAVRETAQTLARLDIASLPPAAAARLAELRAAKPLVTLPRSHPTAAQHLLDRAERLAVVLEIAGHDDGAAVDVGSARARRAALRTFAAAVRRARVAAVNAPLDDR